MQDPATIAERIAGSIFPSESASNDYVTRAILETLHGDQTLGCGRG